MRLDSFMSIFIAWVVPYGNGRFVYPPQVLLLRISSSISPLLFLQSCKSIIDSSRQGFKRHFAFHIFHGGGEIGSRYSKIFTSSTEACDYFAYHSDWKNLVYHFCGIVPLGIVGLVVVCTGSCCCCCVGISRIFPRSWRHFDVRSKSARGER